MYRKNYRTMIINFLLISLLGLLFFLPCFYYAMYAKYKIISNFEKALQYENDAVLAQKGGADTLAIWLPVLLLGLPIVFLVLHIVY